MRLLKVRCPYPPGFNASYRATSIKGKAVYYKTARAKAWQTDATEILKEALQTAGMKDSRPFCWLSLYTLYSQKMDADAPQKLVADALRDALGVDDSRLACFSGSKVFCARPEQCIEISVFGRDVADDEDFNAVARAAVDEILLAFDALCR